MLRVGTKAPSFDLPSTDGGTLSLETLRGRNVVLYFYPRDMTPGCTREAEAFRDAKAALAKRNAIVVGVSKDSIETHHKFCDRHSLNFPLLTDSTGEIIQEYGAWGEKNMYGKKSMGIVRTTVVIGPDGTVRKVFPKVKVDGHADAVINALDGKRDDDTIRDDDTLRTAPARRKKK